MLYKFEAMLLGLVIGASLFIVANPEDEAASVVDYGPAPSVSLRAGSAPERVVTPEAVMTVIPSVHVSPLILDRYSVHTSNVLTVHTDLPYSLTDPLTVTLNGVPVLRASVDPDGDLIAEFPIAEISQTVAPPRSIVVLAGKTMEGIHIRGEDVIAVR